MLKFAGHTLPLPKVARIMKAPHHIQTSHQIWDNHDDTSNQFTIPTNVKMNPTAKKKLAPRFKPLSPFMLPLPLGLRASKRHASLLASCVVNDRSQAIDVLDY
jgi:hypothetical protein